MKLILGIGLVGKAVVEYFKGESLCFYDDEIKEHKDSHDFKIQFFSDWKNIDKVIVSPGIPYDHFMIKEAENLNIPITTDIEIFLKNENYPGLKIGITGTNGKSTLCSLLKYILGDLAELGGNFGKSPLEFQLRSFYILELSSYQLFWLNEDVVSLLDIGVITNIGNHHLSYHKTKSEYIKVKKKILCAKNSIFNCKYEENVIYPKNVLFERAEYKNAWHVLLKILEVLNFDEKKACIKLESYVPLKYRQEVISEKPLIVNDSKSTNLEALHCALKNMKKEFVLITQVNDYLIDEYNIDDFPLLKKVFILSQNEVINLNLPFYLSNSFSAVVKSAYEYSQANNVDILFSPGKQSFEFFKNFEHRGAEFNLLINDLKKTK